VFRKRLAMPALKPKKPLVKRPARKKDAADRRKPTHAIQKTA